MRPVEHMFRYLPGLVLVQLVALALYATNAGAGLAELAMRVAVPALVVTLVTALWFANLARLGAERRQAGLVERHAREREALKVEAVLERERVKGDAARERDKALERLRRDSRRTERRTGRLASLKIGGAYLVATGLGVLFLFTELLTLGLLTITTSGGVLGGYLMRWRQTRQAEDARTRLDAESVPPKVADEALAALPDPMSGPAPTPVVSDDAIVAGRSAPPRRGKRGVAE